ncbi:MAG: phosphatidate cytidylyltransferase [Clostridia bacterium]|nr:phosphatidate cytidylyltransferase [Clostridia bacterium]
MKKRVISAVVFFALWAVILIVDNKWFDTISITLLSVIATYEYLKAIKGVGSKPISWIAYLGCCCILFTDGVITEEYRIMAIKIVLPLALIGAFAYLLLTSVKRTIIDVAITVFGVLYIPVMFSFIKLILGLPNGRFYILFALCGAFISDTFAFLIGSKFGKTKLAPDISPNKTVEGSIGGIFGVLLGFAILALVGKYKLDINVNIVYWLFVGLVSAVAGQFGDLTASAIKRQCKIKDFGKIMPGHGGILDRFDSLMFVAPIVYIFIKLYI